MSYQRSHHSWGPGTVIRPPTNEIDDQPQWWRAVKGLATITALLCGGVVLFIGYLIVAEWFADDHGR